MLLWLIQELLRSLDTGIHIFIIRAFYMKENEKMRLNTHTEVFKDSFHNAKIIIIDETCTAEVRCGSAYL